MTESTPPDTAPKLEDEPERRPGIEEQLWADLLVRADFTEEDAKPMLAMARKRDMDIRRIMRGLDKILNAVEKLDKAPRARKGGG